MIRRIKVVKTFAICDKTKDIAKSATGDNFMKTTRNSVTAKGKTMGKILALSFSALSALIFTDAAAPNIFTPAASAQAPEAIATFRDWSIFVKDVDGDRICFAATEAKNKQPTNVRHGDVFFLVATWRSGAATNQPSLMTGYPLKSSPEPVLRIGGDRWEMYTSENEAFIESDSDETRLVTAMRRGADMRVSAVSTRGTATSYVISLRGISAALDRTRAECQ